MGKSQFDSVPKIYMLQNESRDFGDGGAGAALSPTPPPLLLSQNKFLNENIIIQERENKKQPKETKKQNKLIKALNAINTPNANMADHSVGARNELHESEASEASVFCFDNASPKKSCFVDGLVCFISLCLRVFEFLNAARRNWNLPQERNSFFFSFPVRLWREDRRSKGVHDRRANCKSLFATFQARIS